MKRKPFSLLLAELSKLNANQAKHVMEVLCSKDAMHGAEEIIAAEYTRPVCPSCGKSSATKWGIVSGLQRYRCKECKRTFNALTGTSIARLRKKELWIEYSQALADGLSLTKAAERCGVDRTTAFRWRHRFLQNAGQAASQCIGITEIDETYFRESYKGKKLFHRKARTRGGLSVRGLSKEQVAVVIARDREGHTHDAVLANHTAKEVKIRLSMAIGPESMLCIDKSRMLVKFARSTELAFETVDRKQRRGRDKVFHIQNVNAYHSRLKTWMRRFNGVATERLENYLCWQRLNEQGLPSPEKWLQSLVHGKIHIKRN